jgi:hypothetical protein
MTQFYANTKIVSETSKLWQTNISQNLVRFETRNQFHLHESNIS